MLRPSVHCCPVWNIVEHTGLNASSGDGVVDTVPPRATWFRIRVSMPAVAAGWSTELVKPKDERVKRLNASSGGGVVDVRRNRAESGARPSLNASSGGGVVDLIAALRSLLAGRSEVSMPAVAAGWSTRR